MRDVLYENMKVSLSMAFEHKNSDSIDLIFWLTNNEAKSFSMLSDFQLYKNTLRNITFKPRYHIVSGQYFDESV